jgi:hypothetical protein
MGGTARPNLHVYDKGNLIDRELAAGRFYGSSNVVTLPVTSIDELKAGLDRLVAEGAFFDRAVFQSHGGPGRVWFGGDALNAAALRAGFAGRDYHLLFPRSWGRIYFDGCNAGQGADGTAFLHAVGSVFLRNAGGFASGWEDVGRGVPGRLPILGDHALHFLGKPKTVEFGPGGVVLPQGTIPCFDQPPSGHVGEPVGARLGPGRTADEEVSRGEPASPCRW